MTWLGSTFQDGLCACTQVPHSDKVLRGSTSSDSPNASQLRTCPLLSTPAGIGTETMHPSRYELLGMLFFVAVHLLTGFPRL
jgi:hypothetical protein